MKISICSDALFMGKDYVTSMRELAQKGYQDIEFWTWWDKDLSALEELKNTEGVNFVAMCTKFVSLVDESQHNDYLVGLKESIEVAKRLGCKTLISQVGDELPGVCRDTQQKALIAGLKKAAEVLKGTDITLVFEPLNTRVDHKGYFLWDMDEAYEMVDAVGSEHVKVLFDIYHQQIMQGDLLRRIEKNISKIGHFHVAGNPGRNEPFLGEINYKEIACAIDGYGYNGYAGLEYFPTMDEFKGLKECREIFGVDQ